MKMLILVSVGFLNEHVGVRRVIHYYYTHLRNAGCKVEFAAYSKGAVHMIDWDHAGYEDFYTQSYASPTPLHFDSSKLNYKESDFESHGSRKKILPKLGRELAHFDEFDECLISNPWLVDAQFPVLKSVSGIVYDVIPNLLALDEIQFDGVFANIFDFSYQHANGFKYYIQNAKRIFHISHHTKSDFELMKKYMPSKATEHVVLPFDFSPSRLPRVARQSSKLKILSVNIFDIRKNFLLSFEVFRKLREHLDFELYFVGSPRMALSTIADSLNDLKTMGIPFSWWVGGSDADLNKLYRECDCLFFPSVYEGLGLPILEAQDANMPSVSSNSSSCSEINYFPDLTCGPRDVDGFVSRLRTFAQNLDRFQDPQRFVKAEKDLIEQYEKLEVIYS